MSSSQLKQTTSAANDIDCASADEANVPLGDSVLQGIPLD